MRYLNRACSIVPDDSYVLTLRAQAKLGCHNYESALTDADRVLVFLREPDNPAALIARGDAFYFMGRFEHALVRQGEIIEKFNPFILKKLSLSVHNISFFPSVTIYNFLISQI